MPVSDIKLNKLISNLNEAPIAYLYDQEEEALVDLSGIVTEFEAIHWAQIKFINQNNTLVNLRNEFEIEFTNNRLIEGFRLEFVCQKTTFNLLGIKSRFTHRIFRKLNIKIRTDFIVKYFSPDEDEIVEVEYGHQECRPKILVLEVGQYDTIPDQILENISEHFTYQEEFINDLLAYLAIYYKPNNKRKYNRAYRFKYFMFDRDKIGKMRSTDDCIESFFNALIDGGFVTGSNSIFLLSLYFSNNNFSNNDSNLKVRWNAGGANLFYLIRELSSKGFIKDARKSIVNIIPLIFVNENGLDFTDNELNSSTPSKKITSELDRIIRLLGQ